MSVEIIKVYKEHLPAIRFVGKCYTNADGNFGVKWKEWFKNGWFDELEKLGKVENIESGYLGFMRCNGADFENTFEYWIGIFLPVETEAPEGFSSFDLAEGNVAVCWIKGREDDGLYGMHDACIAKYTENGMANFMGDDKGRALFFERYNCPRFTTPDADGNVILDYAIYLSE